MLGKIIALSLLVFAPACSAGKAPVEDVHKAADLFFQRLNDADYDAIYKDASEEYRKQETRDSSLEKLKQIAPFGKNRFPKPIKMPITDNGKTVEPVYPSVSEAGRGSIKLTFIDEKGEWKLRFAELARR